MMKNKKSVFSVSLSPKKLLKKIFTPTSQPFDEARWKSVAILWWVTLVFTLLPVIFLGFDPWFFGKSMIAATVMVFLSDFYDMIRWILYESEKPR